MNPEVFILPQDGNNHLLYAPLQNKTALLNQSAVYEVASFLKDSSKRTATIEQLQKEGFWEEPTSSPQATTKHFSPIEVTLFPSESCNMGCSYCYASAKANGQKLKPSIAESAIQLVSKNALLNKTNPRVLFHGNGEPTTGWNVLEHSVNYAKKTNSQFEFCLASNGTFSEQQAHWIGEHFDCITISWDGPFQDMQRPMLDHRTSSQLIASNIEILQKYPIEIVFRSTLTSSSVSSLRKFPTLLQKKFPKVKKLHVEPAWISGRCTSSLSPNSEVFVSEFLHTREIALDSGIELIYSGLRLEQTSDRFCGISTPGFTVLPTGKVSACYEICEDTDPRSKWAHFGHFDESSQSFVFEQHKIEQLQLLTLENFEHCKDCFCKWNCSGDCPAKTIPDGKPEMHKGSERCLINRAIAHKILSQTVSPNSIVCQ